MGLKVASTGLHWSQPSVPHSPSSSQTLASAISSPSSKRRGLSSGNGALVCSYINRLERSALFGTPYSKLSRTGSWQHLPRTGTHGIRRVSSASFDAFSDEEFSKKIEELASMFQVSDDDSEEEENLNKFDANSEEGSETCKNNGDSKFLENGRLFEAIEPPRDWNKDIIPANIERNANSVDLPFSLRIIKRKKQLEHGFREAGESAYCSVKKAFSSMVFIIRELHSYTLQMREMLYYEDLQGILARVQKEMHMSFVWLFQQVFSHTPTLMVYVMILLANYSVYSMANNIEATPPTQPYAVTTESVSVVDDNSQGKQKFDSSVIKTYSVSSSGKTTSIGGSNGGGGKFRPVASGTEGDGSFDKVSSGNHRTIVPDGVSSIGNPSISSEGESVSKEVTKEEETRLWNSIVEEASRMQAAVKNEALDHETMQTFVSPFSVEIEGDDRSKYTTTELLYQLSLAQDPENALLLTNFAQFLYLVIHDYDRYRSSTLL